ncbi:hypothetical protein C8N35_1011330 [Breoghania corrubedonensis]|uniref:Probable membrane transporter protein n=1 Tax=Breoghania corrubedonensis TaxID=665038 RepID=A0A2T5VHP4_9HYPH|nr:sulfite exporter TauE/SafE family protein [Breoghania corrubedonensis]PTW63279.1 hypothetical protein C8N35_1011330 [Breoghania corrubedonensis]
MLSDPSLAVIAFGVFLFAGLIKGTIGLGLPTISLGLLTAFIGLPQAMALMLVPAFLTNVWQAFAGGHARQVLHRVWPFLLAATVTVPIGASALTLVDLDLLTALLGVLLISYSSVNLAGIRLSVPSHREGWVGVVLGLINGVFSGMTGSYSVPGVMFLQGIGLPREQLIQAMGMLYLGSTIALAAALGGSGLVSVSLGVGSVLAVVPALTGVFIGQKLRRRLSEVQFRRIFFVALLLLGVYVFAESVASHLA